MRVVQTPIIPKIVYQEPGNPAALKYASSIQTRSLE
jgi:hypothetical protein